MGQTEASNGNQLKRIFRITLTVLAYVLFALCLCFLIFTIVSKRSDGAISIFGREMRLVLSGSMEEHPDTDVSEYKIKSIPVKSMVFIQKVPQNEAEAAEWYKSLKKGDVLTFSYLEAGKKEIITHRIIGIEDNEAGGYIISLRADNGEGSELRWQIQVIDTSAPNRSNYVIGKVTGKSRALGEIMYFLNQPLGMGLIIVVPSAILIMAECVRLGGLIGKLKEEKRKEQETKDEIEEEEKS